MHDIRVCVDLRAVSRIKAKGDLYEMDLLLDVNTDLYPMDVRGCIQMCCNVDPLTSDHATLLSAPQVRCNGSQMAADCCSQVGEKFSLALSPTLNTDSSAMSGHYDAVRDPHHAGTLPSLDNHSVNLHSSAIRLIHLS